jgi:hypothetical protein
VKTLSLAELRQLAESVGFRDDAIHIAAAVAMAESGGDTQAIGKVNHDDRGLWQINVHFHPEFDPSLLFDPIFNARAAFRVSKGGTDFTPWVTFNKGLHQRYMPTPAEGTPTHG